MFPHYYTQAIPQVGTQLVFLITWDAGGMLQIWRCKSLFKPWKHSEVPKLPAFSSPFKEEERFNFLQFSIFPPPTPRPKWGKRNQWATSPNASRNDPQSAASLWCSPGL